MVWVMVGYRTPSTAPGLRGREQVVRVTHPFHPWCGREFVFLAVRQTWGEDRVYFLDGDAVQYTLPVGWTDAAAPDAFVVAAGGRCAFRMEDLLALARLVDGFRG
jgi:hypothetical protein